MDPTAIPPYAGVAAAALALIVLIWAIAAARARRAEAAELRRELETAEAATAELRAALDAAEHEIANVRVAEGRCAASREALLSQFERAGAELAEARRELREALAETGRLNARIAELQVARAKDREAAAEQIRLLSEVRKDMEDRFRQLADETMRRHGEDFSKTNKERIDAVLTPLKEHVGRFEQELRAVHEGAAKDRARLKTEIEQLTRRSEEVSKEALNLTRALKGDKQRQGAWGEMVLARILETSGLREGEEYELQAHRVGDEGERLRPDVIVHMPGDRRLVIDSKVSLNDYERLVSAEDDEARRKAARAHALAVRGHIDRLASKGYHMLEDGAVDYVIMFVPIEGALSEALREQGELTSYALEKGVTIAAPTTLMMALRTIEHVWAVERRNRNAGAIADRAGRLYDKVVGFLEEMEKVGQRLDQAQDAHRTAMDRLARGRGNVLSQAETLKALGAKTAKSLPVEFEGEAAQALTAEDGET